MARNTKNAPGRVRDAILGVLSESPTSLSVTTIIAEVQKQVRDAPPSSVRSYLRLNTPELFVRETRGAYRASRLASNPWQKSLPEIDKKADSFSFQMSELHHDDCFAWLDRQPLVARALSEAGLERRGEIVRLTMTMRGGDRPKGAHEEFHDISVMPRSMWEPWLVFRKQLDGRVQDNLRKWKTGGFRRPEPGKPFGDVIPSAPSRKAERRIAPHPSLKPQAFLRQVVRGVLPLGEGKILDPFAGSGSTLAACNAMSYESVGVEQDPHYFSLAVESIPKLTNYQVATL